MIAAPIHIAGERLMLDPAGALHWPATGTLVVSDLHLENRSSVARRGMLPLPSDTHATLNRLTLLLRRYRPRLVVVLGGPFHDDDGTPHLPAAALARLTAMTAAHRFIWVHGNHGPTPPAGIGGERVAEFSTARLMFHHTAIPGAIPRAIPGATAGATGEICGRYRPRASDPTPGGSVSRPCFVADARRILLPALGAQASGMDVRDPAIMRLFPRGARVFLLGKERLCSFVLGTEKRSAAG